MTPSEERFFEAKAIVAAYSHLLDETECGSEAYQFVERAENTWYRVIEREAEQTFGKHFTQDQLDYLWEDGVRA